MSVMKLLLLLPLLMGCASDRAYAPKQNYLFGYNPAAQHLREHLRRVVPAA
jgi:hypothetical protein